MQTRLPPTAATLSFSEMRKRIGGTVPEVYGETAAAGHVLRKGAKLELPGGYLPPAVAVEELTGFTESW